HARSRAGPDAELLAPLPDARVSGLGTIRVLPVERRIRIPRSAPGHAGASGVRPSPRPGAPAARGYTTVPRRRRPALVARAWRPGRANPVFRRPALAGLRDAPIHQRNWRRERPGRSCAISERAAAES